jgi:gliding motility-associated-like protein
MIMKTYIHKYKLAFLFLFLLISGIANGQRPTGMEYKVYDPQYFFACNAAASDELKTTPLDLFKVSKMYVSPEYGYWGDINGVPFNGSPYGRAGADTIKERRYTDGNIFTPSKLIADTGIYNFYFFFTSTKEYCGIRKGTTFKLSLYIGSSCMSEINEDPPYGILRDHIFCQPNGRDPAIDQGLEGLKFDRSRPLTIGRLLFEYAADSIQAKYRDPAGDWVPIEVYSDRERNSRVNPGENDMEVNLSNAYDSVFYLIIQSDKGALLDSINIKVHPKSELKVTYLPDDITVAGREYTIDDQITIIVNTSKYEFDDYTFWLNNKDMNKYYLGGNKTRNEITLSALAFSGIEDFLEVVVTDRNSCRIAYETNVIVDVPFPTVFTPDGDGVNDVFLGGEKFRNREFHLEVSNRWGSLLYSGESGWDGTYRGNKAPPGTYLYTLILKMEDGSSRTVKNTVILIRENR